MIDSNAWSIFEELATAARNTQLLVNGVNGLNKV
jgi:hypothetical protein